MDPSSSNFNCAQREIITYMHRDIYKVAFEGNKEKFTERPDHLLKLTPQKNTVLHISLTNQTEPTDFVQHILNMCPSLLKLANIKGETPLHIAARHGHVDLVKVLIERTKVQHEDLESGIGAAREMLKMTNEEKDTALHLAVRHNRLGVVKVLIAEYPDYPCCANDGGETPLYMAAIRGYLDIVVEILEKCTSKAYGGPNGKTALHAAVIRGDQEMTKKILEKTREDRLTQKADQKGWIPLHYASDLDSSRTEKKKDLESSKLVLLLIKSDNSTAYIPDRDGKVSLHIAVNGCNKNMIQVILFMCPDCCELVDNRGRNAFHIAMESKKPFIMTKCLLGFVLNKNLVNERDFEGNTPLHLLAACCSNEPIAVCYLEEVDIMKVDKQNRSAIEILSANNDMPSWKKDAILGRLKRVDDQPTGQDNTFITEVHTGRDSYKEIEKGKEYHLVVAALIATVTFAAAFTVPGGNISEKGPDQGTAILRRSSAFKAFVITDAMAMVASTSAVSIHFLMALEGFKGRLLWLFGYSFNLTVFAMGAMVVAFVTGTYAVLAPSPGLAVVTSVIALSFFLNFLYVFKEWVGPISD